MASGDQREALERKAGEAGATPAGPGEEAERVGPLWLTRHRKDDGRALLLYAHAGDTQARGTVGARGGPRTA